MLLDRENYNVADLPPQVEQIINDLVDFPSGIARSNPTAHQNNAYGAISLQVLSINLVGLVYGTDLEPSPQHDSDNHGILSNKVSIPPNLSCRRPPHTPPF